MNKLDLTAEADTKEEYDSPSDSKWIVAVGICGTVVVLVKPNIHYSFFDNGSTAEDIGLPYDSTDEPGVYEWTCKPKFSRDWESGLTEFEGFCVMNSTKISFEEHKQ